MIVFNNEITFNLADEKAIRQWISNTITEEGFIEGEINYIFCSDEYLLEINLKYLKHNILTDVISFDYTLGKLISGDVFISIERVQDNALSYSVPFQQELSRVMIHGILHYCGYKDKTKEEKLLMRSKEDYYLNKL